MTEIGFLTVCKACKQPVDPNQLEAHLKTHAPSVYFDVVPVIQSWDTKKRGKK